MTALVLKLADKLTGSWKPKGILIAIEKKRLLLDDTGRCVGIDVVLFNRRVLPAVRTKVSVVVLDDRRRVVTKGAAVGTLARRDVTTARIEFGRPLTRGRYKFKLEVQWPTMGGDDPDRAAGPNQATAEFVGLVR